MQIGETERHRDASAEFYVEVAVPVQDLQREWRRCNMLANYLAEYSAYQFQEREWAENMISTIINEFLEAIAVLAEPSTSFTIRCQKTDLALQIAFTHTLLEPVRAEYMQLFTQLEEPQLDTLYYELLTASELAPPAFNQLGIVMLAHDFQAQIGAQFAADTHEAQVTISVPLSTIVP